VTTSRFQKVVVLYAVTAVCFVALSGGVYSGAVFTDQTTGTTTVNAANDFTIDVGAADVDPSTLYEDGDRDRFSVTVTVDGYDHLVRSAFELSVEDRPTRLQPTDVTCTPDAVTGDAAECTVTFGTSDLFALTDDYGDHSVVLHGAWDYPNDFVADGQVTVAETDDSETESGNTDDGTEDESGNTDDGTEDESGNTDDGGNTDGSTSNNIASPGTVGPAAGAGRYTVG
jgi:hypothetical protein